MAEAAAVPEVRGRCGSEFKDRDPDYFEEAIFGCQKEIELNLKDECPKCHGTGAKPERRRSPVLNVTEKEKSFIRSSPSSARYRMYRPVPTAMVRERSSGKSARTAMEAVIFLRERRSRLRSRRNRQRTEHPDRRKGEPGTNGGERGDLLVEVTVSRHPVFKRQETTIFSTVPISFATAALGGTIHIKTVDGDVEYEVKPGTQTDTKVGCGEKACLRSAIRTSAATITLRWWSRSRRS